MQDSGHMARRHLRHHCTKEPSYKFVLVMLARKLSLFRGRRLDSIDWSNRLSDYRLQVIDYYNKWICSLKFLGNTG